MSHSWIVETPLDKLDPAKTYFITRRWKDTNDNPHYSFYCCGLNGKETWAGKPGIAIRYVGSPGLRDAILKNSHIDLIAVEVPIDADKRWKARKHQFRTRSPR